MFVKFVAVLSDRGDIPHESDIIQGKQFRQYVIEEICGMTWQDEVIRSYLTIVE